MHQRFPAVAIVLLALVVSVAGAAIATAFCPDSGNAPACHEMVELQTHVHHETSLTSIEQPLGSCSHCISHSNLPRTALEFRQADMPRPSNHADEAETVTKISYLVLVPRIVNAREHAPPGRSSPLHVQLNVFRI
jgi:hypothetical protein